MASGTVPTAESRSAKKKKGKTEAASNSSAGNGIPSADTVGLGTAADGTNGVDGATDSPYLRELTKSIRNVAKKIAASSKTESVVEENPGQSLDDLIASKTINADQKAQLAKKPGLLAEKARLEDQVVHYRKFGKDYEDRFSNEKAALEESHAQTLAKIKLDAADEAAVSSAKKFDDDLLVLSQFLHAAAAKRQDEDLDPVEKAAFEGVLLLVYQGNNAALAAFKDITAASPKRVLNTEGDQVDFTFAQIKEISMRDAPPLSAEEPLNGLSENEVGPTNGSTDPTIANAGMTELTDGMKYEKATAAADTNTMSHPAQSSIPVNTANAAAERSWDPQASIMSDTPSREGWVEVPRDPAETDTGTDATPAAVHGSSSWDEEVTAKAAADGTKPTAENDGFEQVVHHPQTRGRGRGQRGDFRGRGGRGGDQRGGGRGRGDRDRGDGGRFRADGDRRGGGGGRGRGRGGEGGSFRGGAPYRGGGRGRDHSAGETGNAGDAV